MKAEFGIHAIEITSRKRADISGRMFSGVLRLGDVFTHAFKIHHKSLDQIPEREMVSEVALEITKILAYGKRINFLDGGLTGMITVEGEGLEFLSPNMSISTCA